MKNPVPDLYDRCRKWIYDHVPAHSQAEYEALLITNRDLALRLISKCIDYDRLLEAHYALEDEVARHSPRIPWTVSADSVCELPAMRRIARVTYSMDPMRVNVAVSDLEVLTGHWTSESILPALRSHFDRVVAPAIWQAAEFAVRRATQSIERRAG